jgi:hypothetical protein
VIDRISKTLALLAILPRLGHQGIVHGTLEKGVPHIPYLVVYRIDVGGAGNVSHKRPDDELVVLRVYHAAQPRSKHDRL